MSDRGHPDDWSIRRAVPGDRDAILSLLRRAFGDNGLGLRQWDWAFLENPSGAEMQYLVAEAEDRIVGQWPCAPVRLQHHGRQIPGLRRFSLVTDPDYRRRGILTTLSRRADEEFGTDGGVVSFGFPNSNSLRVLCRTGAVELRPYPLLVRPVAGIVQEAARRRRWALPAGAAGQALYSAHGATHQILAKRGNGGARTIEEFESFGPWADRLWEELSPQLGTCTIRDAAYLNWRFAAAPLDYRQLALSGPRGPEGFAITGSFRRHGQPVIVLMELMARPGDRRGARLLIDHVLREARAERAAAIAALATRRHPFRRELMQAGFLPAPWATRGLTVTARIFGRGRDLVPNELFHVDDWYLSGADPFPGEGFAP